MSWLWDDRKTSTIGRKKNERYEYVEKTSNQIYLAVSKLNFLAFILLSILIVNQVQKS